MVASDLRIVALQLRGKKPLLYCVPGAGSDALALRELAHCLGEEQPFFAFQPAGLDGRASYLRSVEEMASLNLRALREQRPKGPYHLCGTSFGGVVAFEMARRLVAEREELPFLALLDTYGGEYPKLRSDLGFRQKLRLALRYFLPAELPLMVRLPAEVIAGAIAYIASMLLLHRKDVLRLYQIVRPRTRA